MGEKYLRMYEECSKICEKSVNKHILDVAKYWWPHFS